MESEIGARQLQSRKQDGETEDGTEDDTEEARAALKRGIYQGFNPVIIPLKRLYTDSQFWLYNNASVLDMWSK